jgi:membrane protein DedA with SNARE-associated domain
VFFNVTGAIIWVVSLTVAGYWFGNLPFVRDNLTLGHPLHYLSLNFAGHYRVPAREIL